MKQKNLEPLGILKMLPITKLNIGLAFQIVKLWSLSLQKENDTVDSRSGISPGICCIRATSTVMNHYDSILNNSRLKLCVSQWSICYKFESFITIICRGRKSMHRLLYREKLLLLVELLNRYILFIYFCHCGTKWD